MILSKLQSWGAAIIAFLGIIAAAFGLKARGDKYKAHAQHEKDRADQNQEVIDDIHQANVANADPDIRDRVRDKYTRD